MAYFPQPFPGGLDTVDDLRRQIEEELARLANAYADDGQLSAADVTAINAAIAVLDAALTALTGTVTTQGAAITTAQGDITALQGQIAQADDIVTAGPTTIALTTTVVANINSVSLPPGTWDLEAVALFTGAGATVTTNASAGLNTVNNALPAAIPQLASWRHGPGLTDAFVHLRPGLYRVTVPPGPNVTYYLNASASFITSTFGVSGYIQAKRVIV